jgi:hypothetical protein
MVGENGLSGVFEFALGVLINNKRKLALKVLSIVITIN